MIETNYIIINFFLFTYLFIYFYAATHEIHKKQPRIITSELLTYISFFAVFRRCTGAPAASAGVQGLCWRGANRDRQMDGQQRPCDSSIKVITPYNGCCWRSTAQQQRISTHRQRLDAGGQTTMRCVWTSASKACTLALAMVRGSMVSLHLRHHDAAGG